jgi:hypothetical protein
MRPSNRHREGRAASTQEAHRAPRQRVTSRARHSAAPPGRFRGSQQGSKWHPHGTLCRLGHEKSPEPLADFASDSGDLTGRGVGAISQVTSDTRCVFRRSGEKIGVRWWGVAAPAANSPRSQGFLALRAKLRGSMVQEETPVISGRNRGSMVNGSDRRSDGRARRPSLGLRAPAVRGCLSRWGRCTALQRLEQGAHGPALPRLRAEFDHLDSDTRANVDVARRLVQLGHALG